MEFWKVLVVDGDRDVYDVTAVTLKRLEFRGKSIRVLGSQTAEEAKSVLKEHPDIALILVDIVMETETAGLDLIKYVRRDAGNAIVQIVIRTSQCGHAPEDRVTIEYEINDYLEKSEITARKLRTSVITALRAYEALATIDDHRRGLKHVIESASHIFRSSSVSDFEKETLSRLASFLHGPGTGPRHSGVFARKDPNGGTAYVTTATGRFKSLEGWKLSQIVDPDMYERIVSHDYSSSYLSVENFRVYGFRLKTGHEVYVILEDVTASSEWKRDLLEAFRLNLGAAVDNFHLYRDLETRQNELVFALGEIAESRSAETGNHVKRVAEIARILALGCGRDENEADHIRMAASLHDLGKLTIRDEILNKPETLTTDEFEEMKAHSFVGFEMLKSSNRELLKSAARIALEHHENYDGTGYPRGLKGEEIGLASRIVAIADVFDALGNKRVYKEAWEIPAILDYMRSESGKKFDPALMDVFFSRVEEMNMVRTLYPD